MTINYRASRHAWFVAVSCHRRPKIPGLERSRYFHAFREIPINVLIHALKNIVNPYCHNCRRSNDFGLMIF
jgi:hypothetical protein